MFNASQAKIINLASPYRYGIPQLNDKIAFVKHELVIHTGFDHATFLYSHLARCHYTQHGLHLNSVGKRLIVNSVCNELFPRSHHKGNGVKHI